MDNPPRRHHYIPQFYIKGFTNQKGFLWIYDKQDDRILSSPKSPKGVFYEEYLNTISINSDQIQLLEKTYQKIEDKVKYLFDLKFDVTSEITDIEKIINHLILFAIQLYWRSPFNKKRTDSIIEFYKLFGLEYFNSPILKSHQINEIDKSKIMKIGLPIDLLLNSILDNKVSKFYKVDNVLVTDNPVIYRYTPITIDDFLDDIVFPINKGLLYVKSDSPILDLGFDTVQIINDQLIEQSNKYVGSPDKDFLEKVVKKYRYWKDISYHVKDSRQSIFSTIEGKPLFK